MTELPKAYEPTVVEEKWQTRWMSEGCFHADPQSEKPAYSIVIPPPNVTGVLHMGHVLNNSVAVASMKIWGTEDIEAITADDKMIIVPFMLLILAALVPLVANINRKLPAAPHPWREKNED